MPAPATSSRHLYTGHRQGGVQGCPLAEGHASGVPLSRGICATPVSMPLCSLSMRQQWYRTCSSSRRTPDPLLAGLFPQRSPRGLLTERSLRWFGLSTCPASPEGQPPSLAQHALWPVDLLHRNHLASGHTTDRRVLIDEESLGWEGPGPAHCFPQPLPRGPDVITRVHIYRSYKKIEERRHCGTALRGTRVLWVWVYGDLVFFPWFAEPRAEEAGEGGCSAIDGPVPNRRGSRWWRWWRRQLFPQLARPDQERTCS